MSVTIIMYHYVRDLVHSRYPEIKARTEVDFVRQLNFLQREYSIISVPQLISALNGSACLPANACLLTFDDGYIDHYVFVFPELVKRGLSAAFYPSVQGARRQSVMDVNKIQFIMARTGYAALPVLIQTMQTFYTRLTVEMPELPSFEALLQKYYDKTPDRYDSPEAVFIKTILQYILPQPLRSRLIDALFIDVVDVDETTLARELYMSVEMLGVMATAGMHIGSHGEMHTWLDKISPPEQIHEVDASLQMLAAVYGREDFTWSMCYPYGASDESLRAICEEKRCQFALTAVPDIARIDSANRFLLPRLDTNDIPIL